MGRGGWGGGGGGLPFQLVLVKYFAADFFTGFKYFDPPRLTSPLL